MEKWRQVTTTRKGGKFSLVCAKNNACVAIVTPCVYKWPASELAIINCNASHSSESCGIAPTGIPIARSIVNKYLYVPIIGLAKRRIAKSRKTLNVTPAPWNNQIFWNAPHRPRSWNHSKLKVGRLDDYANMVLGICRLRGISAIRNTTFPIEIVGNTKTCFL